MSATILITRTQGTSPPTAAPVGTGVSFGELIYTYDVANVGAGKSYKKLYIGDPSGNTEAPIPIGGEYYTQVIEITLQILVNQLPTKQLFLTLMLRYQVGLLQQIY